LPDATPQRRFRWLRLFFLGAALTVVALSVASFIAVQHLDWIAKFAIHRMFPGVTAEMSSLRAASFRRLEVSKLTLRAAKSKEPLLTLEGGVVVFSFSDVWRARLEEVRLTSPNLVVSPDLGEALGVQPAKSAPASRSGGGSALNWAIARLVVTDGSMRITRLGEWAPSVAMNFAVDFRNFGVGGAAASEEHTTELTNVSAADANGREFLRVPSIGITFTTGELFTASRVRAVRIGAGDLTLAPGLFDALPSRSASPSPASSAPGWTIGALDLDALHVTIPNAPGLLGRAAFRVGATLRELGATGTPAGDAPQEVRLTKLEVSTDLEPDRALLAANSARARFTIAGLTSRRLDELTLENPSIDVAPEKLLQADSPAPTKPSASSAATPPPPTWLIARVRCDYGALHLRDLKAGAVDFDAKFAFDLHDLGTAGEAGRKAHELTFWDARATATGGKAAFLTLDVGTLSFTPESLLAGRHLEGVRVNGGRLTVGDALQKLLAAAPDASPAQSTPAATDEGGWSIGTLDIAGIRTRIEDRRPGVTDLHFTINTTLRNVQAGGAASALLEEVQTVEFANIDLRSPLNRDALIVSLRSVFVRFTLRDLARKHLREVVILRPSIFLSQDLFVYMERATAGDSAAKPAAPAAPAPVGPNWSVDHLEVKFGRLVLGSGGSKDVGLPLEFETTADNLSLDNLAALQLQAALRVPKQSYDFPDYQIEVKDVVGDLRFSYPPEKGEKNLVQKLDIAAVRWRQYRADKTWIAATFDASGINGLFGGEAYGGYLNGGFSFFFQDDSPWIGWIAGTDVDTKSFTDIISPQNFRLTGPLNFEMQLDAFRKNISRVRGVFHLTRPGRLTIGKIDDLLANLPDGWSSFKREPTRVALETLRDFDYTTAGGDFWFVDSQGILTLDLLGPAGSRKFEVALHDGEETSNQWQLGKLGKK